MQMLKIKYPNDGIRYPEDVERIGKILYDRGYFSTPEQCQQIWELYSDTLCAGWLGLPEEDEHVMNCIRPFICDDQT